MKNGNESWTTTTLGTLACVAILVALWILTP